MGALIIVIVLAGLVGLGMAVGLFVRSSWALLFPPALAIFWLAGNALFAETDPDGTARSAILSALVMIVLPVATGTLLGLFLSRRSSK